MIAFFAVILIYFFLMFVCFLVTASQYKNLKNELDPATLKKKQTFETATKML